MEKNNVMMDESTKEIKEATKKMYLASLDRRINESEMKIDRYEDELASIGDRTSERYAMVSLRKIREEEKMRGLKEKAEQYE